MKSTLFRVVRFEPLHSLADASAPAGGAALARGANEILRARRAAGSWIAVSLAALAVAACDGGSSSGGGGGGGGGTLAAHADGTFYLVESNAGGTASDLEIVDMRWGRLVDVLDETGTSQQPNTLVLRDFLIDHEVTGSTLDYSLVSNPVTGKETLIIHYPKESAEFLSLIHTLEDAQPVLAKGLEPSELPPFTAVARNSALVFCFNDLVDEDTVSQQTVILEVGNPPSAPFASRIVVDPSHGDASSGTFHSTRVIVDFTVSTIEAQQNPQLQVNTLGLPAAALVSQANAVVRFPTQSTSGQFDILTNLGGKGIDFDSGGPSLPNSPTLDVVRSFRSQGPTSVTGDPNNGFLPDDISPNVLALQGVFVGQPNPSDPGEVDITFTTGVCAMQARAGDVLEFADFILQVVSPGTLVGSTVEGAQVVALAGDIEQFGPSFGVFKTTWSPALGVEPECFVRFTPLPAVAPNQSVSNQAAVLVSFSEPMDPTSVQALETFTVKYEEPPVEDNPMFERVVGRISPSDDLQVFAFEPSLPLRHTAGTSENYLVDVQADDPSTLDLTEGVTDLAGNPLAFDLPQAVFGLAAAEPTEDTSGFSLRFVDPSFDEDGDDLPEVRGQQVYDTRQLVKPRGFTRFSVAVDPSQPLVGAMIVTPPPPLVTPLSPFGSRTMGLWRYIDLGFSLLDDQNHNLDIEGLHWSPFGTGVQQDFFENFRLAVAHSSFAPDEVTSAGLLPQFKESGLVPTFITNLLDATGDPLTVLAAKDNGYLIQPSMLGQTTSGVLIVPWPINQNTPLSEYTYWTWRDTAKLQVGGPNTSGADPQRLQQVLAGVGMLAFYGSPNIPTIGLPLLTEFRCYPSDTAFGLNGFQTSFALNSSYKPCFRAFSTGGQSSTGTVIVNPDNELIAKGGVNPITGAQTNPIDNTFYWGQADFAVRVSRMVSRWIDTGGDSTFAPEVVEPTGSSQPLGTSITVAWRGASALTAAAGTPWVDAGTYDPYGDGYTTGQLNQLTLPATNAFSVTLFPSVIDKSWSSAVSGVNGARFVQFRVTFLANAESGLEPELSAFGLAFRQ